MKQTATLSFIEIFDKDGIYTAEGFASGMGVRIKHGTLSIEEYTTPQDILTKPYDLNGMIYRGVVINRFKPVSLISQLFLPFETI